MRLSVKHIGMGTLMLANVLAIPGIQAEVYKWVDEQGVVNYTKSPPGPSRDAKKLNIDGTRTESRTEDKGSTTAEDAEKLEAQSEATARYKENLEKLKKSCEKSRNNLALFKGDMPVSMEIEGKFVTLTPEQRQAEIDNLEKSIQEHCPDF